MILIDASGQSEFVGVWGRRAISRFKRVLRERGAEFVIRNADANNRVVKSCTQYYGEPEPNRTSVIPSDCDSYLGSSAACAWVDLAVVESHLRRIFETLMTSVTRGFAGMG